MNRCSVCVMPDTRPDTEFVDGVCSACIAYHQRRDIDWNQRRAMLEQLLEAHSHRPYTCIVPSSGGKDSTYQVLELIRMGAKPLVVTATTCHLTDIGRHNIDNLKRFATTIEVSPNAAVRAQLNRIGLETVGDISWPEHVAIFTTPFRVSVLLGIPLIFYGENPQNQYGGPLDSIDAMHMTQRWVSEFGGMCGMRAADVGSMHGINMTDYTMPPGDEIQSQRVEAHFLGQYIPWDSARNAEIATNNGMRLLENWDDTGERHRPPGMANWWLAENLDNAQTGIHDHMMYRKFGYGRGCAQISVDVRAGNISREQALQWVRAHDGAFPHTYMDVPIDDILRRINMDMDGLMPIIKQFTNWSLFRRELGLRPILEEFTDE